MTEESYRELPPSIAFPVDHASQIMKGLMAWKEALLNRMLRHWNPAWGLPKLVETPTRVTIHLYEAVPAYLQKPDFATAGVIGLAPMLMPADRNPDVVRVRAADHLDANNRPMAPEGPFLLPDDRQWAAWRADYYGTVDRLRALEALRC
jgi:hypothetical protein